MNKNFKRVVAYIIDTILISLVAVVLTNIRQINFQLDNYNDIYDEYDVATEKYDELKEKYDEALEKYEEEEISEEEYQEAKEEFDNYEEEYTINVKKYNYKLSKNSIISSVILIALVIAYFGIFQYSMNGQTLGKKIMKLRVVKNKEGKLNILNYLIRCVILNGIIGNIALLICVFVCNYNSFYTANYIITNMESILEIIILIMIFMSKDNRGLHDYLAGTKVIEIDNNGAEVEYIPPTKKEVE